MLSRINRLTSSSDFDQLKQNGQVIKIDICSLVYLNRKDNCPWRMGVIVSKKTAQLAVVRNRLKRQYREVVKRLASKLNPGYDILFLVRGKSVGLSQIVLEPEIAELLGRGGLMS